MQNPYTIRQKAAKWLCWLVAICLVNSIIDSTGRYTYQTNRDKSSYNEIETIAEWMLEEIADIENAIPEDDVPDEELIQKDVKDWQFEEPIKIPVRAATNGCLKNGNYTDALPARVSDKIFPPPELKG